MLNFDFDFFINLNNLERDLEIKMDLVEELEKNLGLLDKNFKTVPNYFYK